MATSKTPEAQVPTATVGSLEQVKSTEPTKKAPPSFLRAMAYRLEDYIEAHDIDAKVMTVEALLVRLMEEIHQLNRATR